MNYMDLQCLCELPTLLTTEEQWLTVFWITVLYWQGWDLVGPEWCARKVARTLAG